MIEFLQGSPPAFQKKHAHKASLRVFQQVLPPVQRLRKKADKCLTAPPGDSCQNKATIFLDTAQYVVPLNLLYSKILLHGFGSQFRKSNLGMNPNVYRTGAEYRCMNPLCRFGKKIKHTQVVQAD